MQFFLENVWRNENKTLPLHSEINLVFTIKFQFK